MNDFDYLLQRDIKSGKEFDKLIPKTNCKATFLGKGMTDFSVDKMAGMVHMYAFQMSKVAEHFRNRSLQQTCNDIHKWCYDHFQYKADREIQYLRSPSCSWHSRTEGIDCKSYSIIASCILTNLGIKHYIRRIKQAIFLPDLWTHVYVVVPKNQKSCKLSEGYYTIDGTVETLQESAFIENSDLFMDMEHYGLNGVHKGLNASLESVAINAGIAAVAPGAGAILALIPQDWKKHLSLNTIKQLFAGGWAPSCINGSLTTADFDATLENVAPAFAFMFDEVNLAASTGDNLTTKINQIFRIAAQIQSHSALKAGGNWKSKCSRDAVNMYKELGDYYYKVAYIGFMGWLQYYFDMTTTTVMVPNNTFEIPINFDKGSDVAQVQTTVVTQISPKATTTNIKQFVLNEYVGNKDNLSNFNIQQFLSGIDKTVATFQSNNGQNTNTPGNNIDPSTGIPYNQGSNIKTAGAGIGGVILFAAGAALLFSNMEDKPVSTSKETKTPVATKKSNPKKTTTKSKK